MPQHYLNHQRSTKVLLALLLAGLASCASERSTTPADASASNASASNASASNASASNASASNASAGNASAGNSAAGTAAAAAEGAAPAVSEAAVPTERECRTVATVSGSKMRRSVCHTPAEWAVIDQRELNRRQSQEDFFRRAIENSTFSSGGSSGSPAGRP
jgi:hypothetical protein